MEKIFSDKKTILFISTIILFLQLDLFGQKVFTYRIYHGSKTTFIGLPGDKINQTDNFDERYLEKGTKVVFEVINANPIFYNYTFSSSTSELELPSLNLDSLIFGITAITKSEYIRNKFRTEIDSAITKLNNLKKDTNFNKNNEDLLKFEETLISVNNELMDKSNQLNKLNEYLNKVLDLVKKVSEIEGIEKESDKFIDYTSNATWKSNFSSSALKIIEKIKEIGTSTFPQGNADSQIEEQVKILKSIFNTYLKILNNYKTAYKKYSKGYVYKDTLTIEDDITKISLNISSLKKDQENLRKVGNGVIDIIIKKKYERPQLSIVPLIYAPYITEYSTFKLENNTITESINENKFDFRVGGMLALHTISVDDANEIGVSFGLGTNLIGGKTSALKEIFIGGIISYRDDFSIGIGWGNAKSPKLVNGASVDKSIPDGTNLNDFIEDSRDNSSFFLIFSLKGFGLPIFD